MKPIIKSALVATAQIGTHAAAGTAATVSGIVLPVTLATGAIWGGVTGLTGQILARLSDRAINWISPHGSAKVKLIARIAAYTFSYAAAALLGILVATPLGFPIALTATLISILIAISIGVGLASNSYNLYQNYKADKRAEPPRVALADVSLDEWVDPLEEEAPAEIQQPAAPVQEPYILAAAQIEQNFTAPTSMESLVQMATETARAATLAADAAKELHKKGAETGNFRQTRREAEKAARIAEEMAQRVLELTPNPRDLEPLSIDRSIPATRTERAAARAERAASIANSALEEILIQYKEATTTEVIRPELSDVFTTEKEWVERRNAAHEEAAVRVAEKNARQYAGKALSIELAYAPLQTQIDEIRRETHSPLATQLLKAATNAATKRFGRGLPYERGLQIARETAQTIDQLLANGTHNEEDLPQRLASLKDAAVQERWLAGRDSATYELLIKPINQAMQGEQISATHVRIGELLLDTLVDAVFIAPEPDLYPLTLAEQTQIIKENSSKPLRTSEPMQRVKRAYLPFRTSLRAVPLFNPVITS